MLSSRPKGSTPVAGGRLTGQLAWGTVARMAAPPVSPRSAGGSHRALLLSALVCPGLGQLANGQWLKGLLMLTGALGGTVWLAAQVVRRLLAALPGPEFDGDPLALVEGLAAAWPDLQAPLGLGGAALMLLWAWSAWDAHRHSVRARPGTGAS